jgi:hypothetical protein
MPARKKTRATRTAAEPRSVRGAVEHGQKLAAKVIASREKRRKGGLEAKGPSSGLVIAEGDSWFDYPFFDTLERLEDSFNFEIESVAHKGDTVEAMAYDASQTATLGRLFEKLGRLNSQPRAILLSGGGNDSAGDEFAIMLNHASSGLPPLNDRVAEGIIDVRLKFAMVSVISGVTALSRHYFNRAVPIILHGYGHAVPDGRGYMGGTWILPGPWLKPGFPRRVTRTSSRMRAWWPSFSIASTRCSRRSPARRGSATSPTSTCARCSTATSQATRSRGMTSSIPRSPGSRRWRPSSHA